MVFGGGCRGLEQGKCYSLGQEGQGGRSGELRAGWPHPAAQQHCGAILLEAIRRHVRGADVVGNNHCAFIKGKSHLSSRYGIPGPLTLLTKACVPFW